MEIRINLVFDNSISRLSGNSYGEEIYIEQVNGKINLSEKNVIVFPNYIEDVAISFIQGFTKNILKVIPKDEFFDHVLIEGTDKVKNKFLKGVYF